jgi:hypothetical protein
MLVSKLRIYFVILIISTLNILVLIFKCFFILIFMGKFLNLLVIRIVILYSFNNCQNTFSKLTVLEIYNDKLYA